MGSLPYPNPTFIFQQRFQAARRDEVVGVLLAFFLGCFGIHHFYLGGVGLGLIYCCFSWTGIPAFLGVIECFFMPARVRAYNAAQAAGIAAAMGIGIPGWIPYTGWVAPAYANPSGYGTNHQPGFNAGYSSGYQALSAGGGLQTASADQLNLMVCGRCGQPNPQSVRYCPNCGHLTTPI